MAEKKDRNGLTKTQKRRARRKRAKAKRAAKPQLSLSEAQAQFNSTLRDALDVARMAGVPIPDDVSASDILKELRKRGIKEGITQAGQRAGVIPSSGAKTTTTNPSSFLRYRR